VTTSERRPVPKRSGSVHVSIDIDAPPDSVWEAIEDIESHVHWMADAESIRFTSEQRQGVGTRFVCRTRIGPIHLDDVMEITAWEAPAAMGVSHHGLVTGDGRFTLTPLDDATRTRFEWREQLRFPWYLGGPFGAAIAAPLVLRPLWRRNLKRLRARITPAQ